MATDTFPLPSGKGTTPIRLSLVLAVGCLGFSAFLTQVTLMRELLSAFAGNELIFGVVLGNWMLLTGFGAAVGKTSPRLKSPWTILILAQVLVALLPIADVFLLRTLRNVIFIRGAEVGVTDSVVTCFVLLAPYCLIVGYLLTLASWFWTRDEQAEGIGRVYFLDNVGSVLGGLAFSFLLVHLLSHFAILYIPACLNLLAAAVTAIAAHRRRMLAAVAAVAIAMVGLIVTVDLDQRSTEILYSGQRIAYRGQSPYGSVVVTQLAGQYNFMENGAVLFSTQSVEQVEETVHYAMAQRPQAKRVLLVSRRRVRHRQGDPQVRSRCGRLRRAGPHGDRGRPPLPARKPGGPAHPGSLPPTDGCSSSKPDGDTTS